MQTHAADDEHSLNDSIMEQLIMVDAAKRASAKRITVVCRSTDTPPRPQGLGTRAITARLLADMFEVAGAKRMISVDLHSDRSKASSTAGRPLDRDAGHPRHTGGLRRQHRDGLTRHRSSEGAEKYAQALHCDLAFVYKARRKDQKNIVEARASSAKSKGAPASSSTT